MYKCDYDFAMNLPSCIDSFTDGKGGHCALGKLYAGILGRELTTYDLETQVLHREFRERATAEVLDKIVHTNDRVVPAIAIDNETGGTIGLVRGLYQSPEDRRADHEKAVRMAFQVAQEVGFIAPPETESLPILAKETANV